MIDAIIEIENSEEFKNYPPILLSISREFCFIVKHLAQLRINIGKDIELLDETTVIDYLISKGVIASTEIAEVEVLTGGVSNVVLAISESLVNQKNWQAPQIIKEKIAPLIKGGGGGQKTIASAGGQDNTQLDQVIAVIKAML